MFIVTINNKDDKFIASCGCIKMTADSEKEVKAKMKTYLFVTCGANTISQIIFISN